MTLLLGDKEVRAATDMAAMIDALESAFVSEDARGEMAMPPRMNLGYPEGFMRVMPAVMPATGVLGLKTFYGSLERGVRYFVVMCSLASGEVLGVVDAAYLTAARTGAVTGIATRRLARPDACVVALIGSGLEAETNLLGVCAVRPVCEVRVYSRHPERRQAFVDRMQSHVDGEMFATSSPEEAVAGADIVLVCTNTGPNGDVAYRGEWAQAGQHVVSIGSTAPQLREIDVATFERAEVVVFDTSFEQLVEESGDVRAFHSAFPSWGSGAQLVDVLCNRAPGRQKTEQVTLFKSVGTAAQDLVGALCVYEEATRRGLGTTVTDVAQAKLF